MTHTYLPVWHPLRWYRQRHIVTEPAIGGAALVMTTIAGSTYNAFAKPLTDVLSPLSLLFLSELLTAFFIILSFGAVPTFRKVMNIKKKHIVPLIAIGLFSSVGGPLLWFIGLHYTTAVNASMFGKVDLIIMLIMARVVLGERFKKGHIASVAVIMTGLIFVSMRGFTEVFVPRASDGIILLSVLSFACGSVVFRKYLTDIEPHIALFVRTMTAVSVFFLLSPFIPHTFISEIRAFPVLLLPALLGFGFVSRFLNVFMYYQAVDRLPVATVSCVCTLDIVGSALFAFAYLGEALEWYHIVGGLFIVAGNLLLEINGLHRTERQQVRHLKQRVSHRP